MVILLGVVFGPRFVLLCCLVFFLVGFVGGFLWWSSLADLSCGLLFISRGGCSGWMLFSGRLVLVAFSVCWFGEVLWWMFVNLFLG